MDIQHASKAYFSEIPINNFYEIKSSNINEKNLEDR